MLHRYQKSMYGPLLIATGKILKIPFKTQSRNINGLIVSLREILLITKIQVYRY